MGVPESDDPATINAASADDDHEACTSSIVRRGSAGSEMPLVRMLSQSNWWSSPGVYRTGSTAPWAGLPGDIVYLTADSPNALEDLPAEGRAGAAGLSPTTYVIGGIVDRVEKPGLSYRRAVEAGLRTARLPLERFLQLRSGGKKAREGGCRRADDVTTLAVVQMLLLFRENGRWGDAVSRCPALRCAPLRKYVRWLPPYHTLNSATRQDVFALPNSSNEQSESHPQEHPNKRKAGSPARSQDKQVAHADSNKTCEACGAGFASRNALFRHLRECTRARGVGGVDVG